MLCLSYGIKPEKPDLICHCEGSALGIASAHSDVMHWFPKHGKSMDTFRADVRKTLEASAAPTIEPPAAPAALYRVRKAWEDGASQTGAYKELDNAREAADEKKLEGYRVFDENGNIVYDPLKIPDKIRAVELPDATTAVVDAPAQKRKSKGRRPAPDPDAAFPVPDHKTVTYVKPTIKNKNIIVGDFTYFSDTDFESRVTHHYDFYGDRLIIGKFCQIARGVEFMMNGANHKMDAVSTFPFYIFEGWKQDVPPLSDMPVKGDTVVGNDVWIGQNAIILPGVSIGDGAIIGANSVVGSDVEPYTIVTGNPAKQVRKRFDEELIALLLEFKWWDLPIEEINKLIPILSNSNLKRVKNALKKKMTK